MAGWSMVRDSMAAPTRQARCWSSARVNSRGSTGFSLRRAVEVPTGRVSVADYARFAASVRALDTADTRRVLVTLAPR